MGVLRSFSRRAQLATLRETTFWRRSDEFVPASSPAGFCRTDHQLFEPLALAVFVNNSNFLAMDVDSTTPDIFDSLPYYDDDLQKFPYLKEKVEQELAREPKFPSTLHPRVPPDVELFAVREQPCLWTYNLILTIFP